MPAISTILRVALARAGWWLASHRYLLRPSEEVLLLDLNESVRQPGRTVSPAEIEIKAAEMGTLALPRVARQLAQQRAPASNIGLAPRYLGWAFSLAGVRGQYGAYAGKN